MYAYIYIYIHTYLHPYNYTSMFHYIQNYAYNRLIIHVFIGGTSSTSRIWFSINACCAFEVLVLALLCVWLACVLVFVASISVCICNGGFGCFDKRGFLNIHVLVFVKMLVFAHICFFCNAFWDWLMLSHLPTICVLICECGRVRSDRRCVLKISGLAFR